MIEGVSFAKRRFLTRTLINDDVTEDTLHAGEPRTRINSDSHFNY